MKKILLIVSGQSGKKFLERVRGLDMHDKSFFVVSYDIEIEHEENNESFEWFRFDPTSFSKLSTLLLHDFSQAMLVMENKDEVLATIGNIRALRSQLRIALINFWDHHFEDTNIVSINSNEIISDRLLNYLPDIPVTAQNVGLAMGEIMDVLVPFGSSYVYRHMATIRQKNWRIVAIYRNNELILTTAKSMIQPNDRLLIVGEPTVLKSVYRAIKRQLGQFPAPFGKNLYLYIDMKANSSVEIRKLMQKALFLHQKFSHRLFIRVVNPTDLTTLNEIKSYDSDSVNVVIYYETQENPLLILQDVEAFYIGLVIVNSFIFSQRAYRKVLYKTQVPILKISDYRSMEGVKEVVVVSSEQQYLNADLEKISTAIFDISSQLGLKLTLFDFMYEEDEQNQEVLEHFENLSDIFSKKFHIIKSTQNPIRALKKRENFLQCLPFNEEVLPRHWKSFLSTDIHKLYYRLDEFHQIFIPTKI